MRRTSRPHLVALPFLTLVGAALSMAPSGTALAAEARLRLATTTSTENSGLLSHLLPPFEQKCRCKVDVIAVGTGKALKLGERGDVDVVLVHARTLEDQFVAQGWGVDRKDVMYNDFVIVGPKGDPAQVKAATSAKEAFRKIALARSPFISRGDGSGTHVKELELWGLEGVKPAGAWYLEAGRGMGAVLTMAAEKGAYTLADRGTYVSHKMHAGLEVLFQGDPALFNPYGVIAVNPKTHPSANNALATRFIDFLTGPEGRSLISGFRINGEQLFFVHSP